MYNFSMSRSFRDSHSFKGDLAGIVRYWSKDSDSP